MTRVMVVDDEKYVRRGIVEHTDWQLIGCEVVAEAPNGEEALRMAEESRPELVISDIRMPKMDGLAMAEELMKRYPGIKVIFLTAYDEFTYARQAVRIGASDYLLKPFDDGELEASVQRLLHLHPNAPVDEAILEEELIPLDVGEGVSNRYVREAIAFIREHVPDSGFTVGMAAQSLGVSEGHLMRLFKSETGVGINTYLTRLRIRKAMDLLKDVQVRVNEAASLVGYQDIAYFSNTFKKLAGVSPSDYQANGLKNLRREEA